MSALLHLYDLSFSRGNDSLFNRLTLSVDAGDRVGLVGHNGSGKSTLLSLITGTDVPDSGEVRIPRGQRTALVEQFLPPRLEPMPLVDAVLDALPADRRPVEQYRAENLLQSLSMLPAQWQQPLGSLSGGEQNNALLARALIVEPEFLLMDEPGNHMDVLALSRLRQFLTAGNVPTFLMVSHDRELLNVCCNRTVFLRDRTAHSFDVPYEQARLALENHDEQAERRRHAETREIKRLQHSARRLERWGREFDNEDLSRKAKSMQKKIKRLEQDQTFVSQGSGLELTIEARASRARSVLTLEQLVVNTPQKNRMLLRCDFLRIVPGERVALLGQNGTGKSTTLNRLLAAFDTPDDTIRFNPNVVAGYYDQELAQLRSGRSRLDWLRDRVNAPDDVLTKGLLQAGVPYSRFDQLVDELSGGERARMMFLWFRLIEPNVLILDEPTNHIDIEGREQLERQLIESGATLLITSHDRRFIENTTTRWLWIRQGELREIHELEEFYDSMDGRSGTEHRHVLPGAANCALSGVSSSKRVPSDANPSDCVDEESILQRIQQLDDLLSSDQARKTRFQKPRLQKRWQSEIDDLWRQLE